MKAWLSSESSCCSIAIFFRQAEPRLCFIASFCITFIAYRTPQSRFTTSITWPKPPSPRTRTTLKSESVGLMFSFALSSRMYLNCIEPRNFSNAAVSSLVSTRVWIGRKILRSSRFWLGESEACESASSIRSRRSFTLSITLLSR